MALLLFYVKNPTYKGFVLKTVYNVCFIVQRLQCTFSHTSCTFNFNFIRALCLSYQLLINVLKN